MEVWIEINEAGSKILQKMWRIIYRWECGETKLVWFNSTSNCTGIHDKIDVLPHHIVHKKWDQKQNDHHRSKKIKMSNGKWKSRNRN